MLLLNVRNVFFKKLKIKFTKKINFKISIKIFQK